MAVTVAGRRDPGARFLTIALAISYAHLLVKAVLWIFAATAIALDELWPLFGPLAGIFK